MESFTTVHVLRHGEVENPGKILYGREPGWRLSERGVAMAESIANWSKTLDIGALHVSPLQRAQETAAPIAKAHDIKITTDDRLIEAANIFEGKPLESATVFCVDQVLGDIYGIHGGLHGASHMSNKLIECLQQYFRRTKLQMAKMQFVFRINYRFG